MVSYLFKRFLRGAFSVVAVVAVVMFLIYNLMDRNLIFAEDPVYRGLGNNAKTVYQYSKWEEYGYLDYVSYQEYLSSLNLSESEMKEAASLGRDAAGTGALSQKYIEAFTKKYKQQGYTVMPLPAVMIGGNKYASGGQPQLFAYRDQPLFQRLWNYLAGMIKIDNIHYVKEEIGERGIAFTLHDPLYGGKFAPAIMGNGTRHKYLLYFDDSFPFLHQNLVTLHLGRSYSVNQGVDVSDTMTQSQGAYALRTVKYPTGLVEESANDLHTAEYVAGSHKSSSVNRARFTDDYTAVTSKKVGMSKLGYSFVIGILNVILAYLIGVPLGILMARKKNGFADKAGTAYVVFIIAVPSLAYIFLFKAIGGRLALPTLFDTDAKDPLMYILPVLSLALPAIAALMKWLRRYMIDQMNADYVKFARAEGMSEGQIFSRHVLKNAAIPLLHGIPEDILLAFVGAIITERVYSVPGAGNLLTRAINTYDNGVIVGVALFYAVLSVLSLILGDLFMSAADPRISLTEKGR